MSYKDYKQSLEISAQDYPYYAIVFAMIETGTPENVAKLSSLWPRMSFEDRPYDYHVAQEIEKMGYEWGALFFSLLRQSDTDNVAMLQRWFPARHEEFRLRYNAPGGYLQGEIDMMRSGDPVWQALRPVDGAWGEWIDEEEDDDVA